MSLSCKNCRNEITELDCQQATIIQENCGTWGVDVIFTCPCCARAYSAFLPTSDLEMHEDE